MIPYSPSLLLLLVYLLGPVAALVLLVWVLRLIWLPSARARLRSHPWSRLVYALLWSFLLWQWLDLLMISKRVAQEIAAEEAKRTPTLQQDTVLAGIAMPAGTRLQLLHHNAVGKQWVKPEYFEQAEFSRPVSWQGLAIRSIKRNLETHQDGSNHGEFATTRVTWGHGLATELATPQTIDGFDCTDATVEWRYHPQNDENHRDDRDDAAQAGPRYQFAGCTSAGQILRDRRGRFSVRAAAGSMLHTNRWLIPDAPQGHLDTWAFRGQLTSDWFALQSAAADLNTDTRTLWRLSGQVAHATAACPLPAGSHVLWQAGEPEVLDVYGAAGIERCGNLRIRLLAHPPV